MTHADPDELSPGAPRPPLVPGCVPSDPSSMTPAWVDALRSREMRVYRQVLGLPGQPAVKAAVVDDLKEYWALDVEDWVDRYTILEHQDVQELQADGQTAAARVGSTDHAFGSMAVALLWRAYLQATGSMYPSPVIASRALRPPSLASHCLDLGSGVGDMAQLLLALGYSVDIADISPQSLDFARWRLARRGQDAHFINLKEEVLPVDRYDVIIAKDVLAHVSRPDRILTKISSALRQHGIVIANVHPDPPALNTIAGSRMHDCSVHRAFIEIGFEMIGSIDQFLFVYRRTAPTR